MDIKCQNCGKKYAVVIDSNSPSNYQFVCKACDHKITIETSQEIANKSVSMNYHRDYARDEGGLKPTGVSFKNSIKTKLGIVLIFVSAIILGAYSLFNYYDTKKNLTAELDQYAKNAAKRLALTLSVPVWEVDKDTAWEIINSEMLDKRVYAILVYEKDGSTIFEAAERNSKWDIEKVSSLKSATKVKSKQAIEMDSEYLGSVNVLVTDRFMRSSIVQSTKELFSAMVVQIFVLLVALYMTLKKLLIGPIAKLTVTTEQISLGNLNTSINIHSKDEIGILAQAIERMQISLRLVMKRREQPAS